VRPGDLTAAHLRAFESEFLDAGLKPSSIDSFHRHTKNFIGYCLREGDGGDEALLRVQGPRLEKHEPEAFTVEEEKALKAALKDRPRDLMLVDLMLATGPAPAGGRWTHHRGRYGQSPGRLPARPPG